VQEVGADGACVHVLLSPGTSASQRCPTRAKAGIKIFSSSVIERKAFVQRNAVDLVHQRLVEALADAVVLRAARLGTRVIPACETAMAD
jgi:hypothetical protein